jgi:hypothetical protein
MDRPNFLLTMLLPVVLLFATGAGQHLHAMGKEIDVPKISLDELKSMLGNPDLVILDVREGESWKKAKMKIAGSVREDPEKGIDPWVSKYPPDKTYVLY